MNVIYTKASSSSRWECKLFSLPFRTDCKLLPPQPAPLSFAPRDSCYSGLGLCPAKNIPPRLANRMWARLLGRASGKLLRKQAPISYSLPFPGFKLGDAAWGEAGVLWSHSNSTPPEAWSQGLGRHWRDALEPLEGAQPCCDLDLGSRKLILDSLTLWWTVLAASGNQYSNWQDIKAHQNLIFTTTKQGEALITVFLKLFLLACTCLWSQLAITCDNFNGVNKGTTHFKKLNFTQ